MSETEVLDDIKQQVSDIAQAVADFKENEVSTEEILEKLVPEVEAVVAKQVKAQKDAAEAARPYRRGEWVGPEGFEFQDQGRILEGKFKGKKAADVMAAGAFMNACRSLQRPGEDNIKALSPAMQKLLDPGVSGSGSEFTFTGLADELWRDIFLENVLINALGGPQSMPTDPWKDPLRGEIVVRKKTTRGEASPSQTPTTADSTFTGTGLIAEVQWDYEMDEDSVIAVMPDMRQMLTRVFSEYMDRFLLNADGTTAATGNINSDDAAPDGDSYYLSDGQDGLRHYYLVDQTGQSANISTTLTDALLRAGIARMGKYGVDSRRSPLITDAKTYLISMMGLTNVVTLDKFGLGATVLTGQLASYQGHPIIPTEAMLLAEDDGKVAPGGTNDEGQIAIPHVDQWQTRFKRQLLIEVDRDIQRQVWIMVGSVRIAVGARDRSSTHTAGIHGITFA